MVWVQCNHVQLCRGGETLEVLNAMIKHQTQVRIQPLARKKNQQSCRKQKQSKHFGVLDTHSKSQNKINRGPYLNIPLRHLPLSRLNLPCGRPLLPKSPPSSLQISPPSFLFLFSFQLLIQAISVPRPICRPKASPISPLQPPESNPLERPSEKQQKIINKRKAPQLLGGVYKKKKKKKKHFCFSNVQLCVFML